jgi:hypothetical protein
VNSNLSIVLILSRLIYMFKFHENTEMRRVPYDDVLPHGYRLEFLAVRYAERPPPLDFCNDGPRPPSGSA